MSSFPGVSVLHAARSPQETGWKPLGWSRPCWPWLPYSLPWASMEGTDPCHLLFRMTLFLNATDSLDSGGQAL